MLGISTSYFAARGFSIYESVNRAVKMGFQVVELGANHDYEENIWSVLRKIKKDFPEVVFTQHCYFPPVSKIPLFSNTAEGLTKDNKRVLTAIFRAAVILKPAVISFHPGQRNKVSYAGTFDSFKGFKKFLKTVDISQEKALKNLDEFLLLALKLGKKHNVKIALENTFISTGEGKTPLKSFEDFSSFLRKFPDLNFLFDYGHATLLTSNPDQFFNFQDRIIEMHIHDVSNQGYDHRILGTGKVNLKKLFLNYKKLRIKPILILEHSGEPEEKEIIKEKQLIEALLKE